MTAQELINSTIPPLKPTDTVQKALDWMNNFHLNSLPVVDKSGFLGFVTEQYILDYNKKKAQISDIELIDTDAIIKPNQHFYDVMQTASMNKSRLVAVVKDGEYLGVIDVKDTIPLLGQMTAMQGPGSILVIKMNTRDYSLQQISRLIEENNAKILSLQVSDDAEYDSIRITIKLNISDLSHVKATLERFGFSIIATFQENELNENNKDRLDLLLKYLNI